MMGAWGITRLVLLLGAALFSAVKIEERLRRNRALQVVHELKALARVVDMHPLTQRPAAAPGDVPDTPSSPRQELAAPELVRSLDSCAEIFAVIGKVAARYGQRLNDPVVPVAVDPIEALTPRLARKTWQKIDVVERRGGGVG